MLLTVDVGNTSTTFGVMRGDALLVSWRLHTEPRATQDEIAATVGQLAGFHGLPLRGFAGAAIASVVPTLRSAWCDFAASHLGCEPLVIQPSLDLGVELKVDHPQQVGADRIADALAAWRMHGAPAVVVDCGTATTVDAVGRGGRYLGGAIAPGVGIASEALFRHAALLHRVELAVPPSAIGANTIAQMQSGIAFGFGGQVDALVERVRDEMGGADHVIATGGYCQLIAGCSRTITAVDPFLTLHGLRLAYEHVHGVRPAKSGTAAGG